MIEFTELSEQDIEQHINDLMDAGLSGSIYLLDMIDCFTATFSFTTHSQDNPDNPYKKM